MGRDETYTAAESSGGCGGCGQQLRLTTAAGGCGWGALLARASSVVVGLGTGGLVFAHLHMHADAHTHCTLVRV